MASLQKIRSHGVLLLIIVGLAMLAFILGDFFTSGSSFFNRSREYVGEIAGENIHYTDYENAREQLTEVYKIESGRSDFDEDMTLNINNQAWQMMVMQYALNSEAKKAGLVVTDDELSELCIGQNAHQLIRQRRAFADENGNFDRKALVQFLAGLEQAAQDPEQAQNVRQAQTYWMYWENAVRLTYLQEKYVALLGELVGANNIDARANAAASQTTVNASYVAMPYQMNDSTIKVTNGDIRKLYGERKQLYKQQPNCNLEYITFDVVPSEQDFEDVQKWIARLQDEFYTTDDVAGVVNPNSDVLYAGNNYSKEQLPEQYREWAFEKGRKAGDVTEVMFADNIYSMARIMEAGYTLPDSVELRYTMLADAEQFDSLQAEWKKGNYGDAQELGWLGETAMPKEFAEKVFAAQKNAIVSVEYGTGMQVAQVMNKSVATPKVKVAILSREVTPSSKTYAAIYNEAKQFVVNNTTADDFENAAAELGKRVESAYNIQKNAGKINDLKQSRQIVRWAYKAEEGEVSDVFECGEQFVVVVLQDMKQGEYRSINDVTPELRQMAIRDKLADKYIKQLSGAATIEEVAQIAGSEVLPAEDITLSSNRFAGAGVEPAVVGAAIALEQGEMSEPVKGQNGVYVVMVNQKTTVEAEANLEQEIQQLKMRYSYSIPYQAMNLVEEAAKVEDNRANFY